MLLVRHIIRYLFLWRHQVQRIEYFIKHVCLGLYIKMNILIKVMEELGLLEMRDVLVEITKGYFGLLIIT